MARKPIHLQAAGKLTPRDRIWQAIRSLASDPWRAGADSPEPFTRDDIADRIVKLAPADAPTRRIEEETTRTYVRSLEAAGYLARTGALKGNAVNGKALFTLARDTGIDAPRVNKAGKAVTQGNGREALWRSMKILKNFTRGELVRAASTAGDALTDDEAQTYIYYLALAGYIALTSKGGTGVQARYRFLAARNSGPRAPQIQRARHVYDPNLGAVVWHPEVNS